MANAESHLFSSCNAVSGRCYNRNRPRSPRTFGSTHAAMLLLLFSMLAAMQTSCLALTSESTTLPSVELEEVTTVIPPQQPANEANLTTTTVVAVNETNIGTDAEKTVAAEVADEFVHTSFVSLGGEGLEQGIRNAVKSEVESEIEADSSGLVETLQAEQQETEQKPAGITDEHSGAAQGVREPKALEAEEETEREEPAKAEEVVKAEKAEETEKIPEAETTKIVEESVETQISEESEKSAGTVLSNVDLAESSSVVSGQVESESRPLPSVTSDLVAVIFDENRAITEQPITKTNLLALEQEHEELQEAEQTTPLPTYEVNKHQVTKKQGVDDLLPIEVTKENVEKQEEQSVQAPELEVVQESAENTRDQNKLDNGEESTAEPSSVQVHLNEIEENIIQSEEKKEIEFQPPDSSTAQPERVSPTEASLSVVQQAVEAVVEASEPVLAVASESPEETLTPTEAYSEQSEVAEVKSENDKSIQPAVEATTPEPSPTASPVKPKAKNDDDSIEDDSKEENDSSNSEIQTEKSRAKQAEKDSSEESDELSEDEPKARAEDSTATPLVSYPPHNAGQTFDSNLADERSAHLSLASTNRSALIIALCSGTAVIFIVISLVIFVLSFQRQRGTLDIEMQEQRLGKDDLDHEDAQMKLLDVDLSTPVIIAMGNEETDECL